MSDSYWADLELARYNSHKAAEMPRDNKQATGNLKPPLYLIPPAANLLECEVMRLGVVKHGGAYNWRSGKIKTSVYLSALYRHVAAFQDGQDDDDESGISHLAHARACLSILIDALMLGRLDDDRPAPGKAAELIARFTREPDDEIATD